MAGSMVPPPQKTGWGCWVRHHLMEKMTMGTSTKAKILNTAEIRARAVGSSMARRSIRYPAYSSQHTSAEVRRASQVHQMPQIMRPQIDPVTRLAARNASPTSVTATEIASYFKFLVTRYTMLVMQVTLAHSIAVMAAGTWKKMMR